MLDRKKIGERIRACRGELSQKAFAAKLNFNQTYISQIELGSRKPSIDFLVKLSDLTDYSVDYILRGSKLVRISKSQLENSEKLAINLQHIKDALEMIGKKLRGVPLK